MNIENYFPVQYLRPMWRPEGFAPQTHTLGIQKKNISYTLFNETDMHFILDNNKTFVYLFFIHILHNTVHTE